MSNCGIAETEDVLDELIVVNVSKTVRQGVSLAIGEFSGCGNPVGLPYDRRE